LPGAVTVIVGAFCTVAVIVFDVAFKLLLLASVYAAVEVL